MKHSLINKIKSFNENGFNHILLPLVVVVVVAVIGTAALVISHAQTPTSSTTSLAAIKRQCTGLQTGHPPTLSYGAHGPCVKALQSLINALEGSPGLPGTFPYHPLAVDGIYGHDTEHDVMKAQQWAGYKINGICGPDTWMWLENQIAGGA